MSIKQKMRPAFQRLEGGLFSKISKADVGDVAAEMARNNVINMNWADPFYPDASIPPQVLDQALASLKNGFPSHYTMPIGSTELRQLIAVKAQQMMGIEKIDPMRHVIINPGSDVGLLFAMAPFINPDDEVLVHDPSYPSNFLNPEILNGVTVKVPTSEADGYRLHIEEYEKRVTPRTKMVVLTNPNNPTGTVYRREDLEDLARFIVRYDLICVCDQAFEDTVFPGQEMVSIAALPGMWERTLTVCSVSKGMGLSGFRIGYIIADDVIMDVLYACAVNMQGAASTLSQMALIPAFKDPAFINEYMRKFDRRRRHAYQIFNAIPGVSMLLPEACFFCWLDVSQLGESGEIVDYLIRSAKVACNDGSFYGDQGKGHIRIVYGCLWDDDQCCQALDRIAEALMGRSKELGLN